MFGYKALLGIQFYYLLMQVASKCFFWPRHQIFAPQMSEECSWLSWLLFMIIHISVLKNKISAMERNPSLLRESTMFLLAVQYL